VPREGAQIYGKVHGFINTLAYFVSGEAAVSHSLNALQGLPLFEIEIAIEIGIDFARFDSVDHGIFHGAVNVPYFVSKSHGDRSR